MDFFIQIGLLFANMTWPVVVCLIVGLVFLSIEIFQPGFGVFGTIGIILLLLGVILRAVFSKEEDNILAQIFILLFIIALITIAAFIIMVKSSKSGWLNRSPLIEKSTAVSTDISEGTENNTKYKDMVGIAVTDLHPVGKINIDGKVLDAQAESFYISKSDGIKIIDVEGGKITVRRIE